uniref:Leucine-rich repeat-containing protein 6 n=1 Tax=Ciona savignyi TaxID=51511 RepID=H2Z732_CIOSA
MARITEELVRKRAEHNECEIFSLEELSLHQQDLVKIEHLDRWCRDLKILYLQNNLIGKCIENVSKLKKLEYLNLALNNVEKIENLKGCESLQKLDLTVNFVGELTSIECLRSNIFLEEIYLTGNPCAQFEGYQDFVFATLPQLKRLDGHEIEKSERIKAMQVLESTREKIVKQQEIYKAKRREQKEDARKNEDKENNNEDEKYTMIYEIFTVYPLSCVQIICTRFIFYIPDENLSKEELESKKDQEFWSEQVDFTPESRTAIQNKLKENKEKTHESKFKEPKKEKHERRYFNEEGKPMNINEGKVNFKLTETDDDSAFVLDVSCYRYMDTSLIDADVQPWYVRVTMKGNLLQLSLLEEVKPDSSTAKRSQITGHLIITMPKLYPPNVPTKRPTTERFQSTNSHTVCKTSNKVPEKLELNETQSFESTLSSIARDSPNKTKTKQQLFVKPKTKVEPVNSADFVDDPDVPPLV